MAGPSFLQMLKGLLGAADPPSRGNAPLSVEPAREQPEPAPTPPVDLARVPAAARDRVAAIQAQIADLQHRAASRGHGDAEHVELTQIGSVYLPRLLKSYAEIPPEHRAEIFRDTGRSASFLLGERLDKILDRLNEISRDFARGHLDAFSDNMRFIDLRYGPSSSPFD